MSLFFFSFSSLLFILTKLSVNPQSAIMTATTNGTNGAHAHGGAPLQRAEELNTVSAESANPPNRDKYTCKTPQRVNSETDLS